MERAALQRRLAGSGAWLFALGMWTGLWTAAALTGTVKVAIPHLALAAHLNALLGGLWLIAVGWSLDKLGYSELGCRRLAWLVQVPAWANWAVTLLASFLGVNGLAYTGDAKNNLIAALLQALVVAPTLVAATAWAWGFRVSPNEKPQAETARG